MKKKTILKTKIVPEFQLGDELHSEETRKAIIVMLEYGMQSEFWQFMVKILDKNIEETKRIILKEEITSIEEVIRWKDKLAYQEELREYPQGLIEKYERLNDDGSLSTNQDPYE